MKRFKQFLSEEVSIQILILEGKAQNQIIKQFGSKILEKIHKESLYPSERYDAISDQPGHGTPEHMQTWITKKLGIPETPHYLDTKNAEHAHTWNQHLNWMLTRFAQGDKASGISKVEDIKYRAIPALERYHKLVQSGKLKTESLPKWKNLTDLESAVNNADPINSTSVPENEYHKLAENDHWHVVIPKTSHAACQLGHGTKWCTTSGAFEHYSEQGPLYIMIPKNPRYQGEKYQLHLESKQLMDKDDSPASGWEFHSHEDTPHRNRPLPDAMTGVMKAWQEKADEIRKPKFTDEEQKHLEEYHPLYSYKKFGSKNLSREATLKMLRADAEQIGIDGYDRKQILENSPHMDRDTTYEIIRDLNSPERKFHADISRHIFATPNTRKHITPEQMDTIALNGVNYDLRTQAIRHGNISDKALAKLHEYSYIQSPSYTEKSIALEALNHPRTSESTLRKYMEHLNKGSGPHGLNPDKAHLLAHPNFPKDVVDAVLDTPTDHIKEHSQLSYNNPKEVTVRSKINPNSPNDTPFRANDFIQMQLHALSNPNVDPRHLTNAVNGHYSHAKQHDVFSAVIYNPSATPEHLIAAMRNAPIDPTTASIKIDGVSVEGNKKDFTFPLLQHPLVTGNHPKSDEIFDEVVNNVNLRNGGSLSAIQKSTRYTQRHENMLLDRMKDKKPHETAYFERKFPAVEPQGQPS
jgi:hypothetical protein